MLYYIMYGALGLTLAQGCPIMCIGGPRVCRFSFQPMTTPADFTDQHTFNQRGGNNLMKSVGVLIGWSVNLHTLGPPWHMIGHPWFRPMSRVIYLVVRSFGKSFGSKTTTDFAPVTYTLCIQCCLSKPKPLQLCLFMLFLSFERSWYTSSCHYSKWACLVWNATTVECVPLLLLKILFQLDVHRPCPLLSFCQFGAKGRRCVSEGWSRGNELDSTPSMS